MTESERSPEPRPWRKVSSELPFYLKPVFGLRWLLARLAYNIQRSPLVTLMKLAATFAVPIGATSYFLEAQDRHRERIYRTWDVVTNAEGKVSSPARYEALEDLVSSNASLGHIVLRDAWLQAIDLRGADLRFADLSGGHLAEANFGCRYSFLLRVRCTNLRWSNLAGANFAWADLTHANLSRATVIGVDFTCAVFADADLSGIRGWDMATWYGADLRNVRNAPAELVAYATKDSFRTNSRALPGRVAAECDAGPQASDRALDTLPLAPTVGIDTTTSTLKPTRR